MRYEKIFLEDFFPNLPKAKEKTQVTLYIPDVWKEVDEGQTFPCSFLRYLLPQPTYAATAKAYISIPKGLL